MQNVHFVSELILVVNYSIAIPVYAFFRH